MDFGGFVLFGVLCFCLIGQSIALVILAFRRTRKKYLTRLAGASMMTALIIVVFGRHLYQVYYLDEELFGAARAGDVAGAQKLLEQGAHPNDPWESGENAMDAAIESGNPKMIQLIRKAGGEATSER